MLQIQQQNIMLKKRIFYQIIPSTQKKNKQKQIIKHQSNKNCSYQKELTSRKPSENKLKIAKMSNWQKNQLNQNQACRTTRYQKRLVLNQSTKTFHQSTQMQLTIQKGKIIDINEMLTNIQNNLEQNNENYQNINQQATQIIYKDCQNRSIKKIKQVDEKQKQEQELKQSSYIQVQQDSQNIVPINWSFVQETQIKVHNQINLPNKPQLLEQERHNNNKEQNQISNTKRVNHFINHLNAKIISKNLNIDRQSLQKNNQMQIQTPKNSRIIISNSTGKIKRQKSSSSIAKQKYQYNLKVQDINKGQSNYSKIKIKYDQKNQKFSQINSHSQSRNRPNFIKYNYLSQNQTIYRQNKENLYQQKLHSLANKNLPQGNMHNTNNCENDIFYNQNYIRLYQNSKPKDSFIRLSKFQHLNKISPIKKKQQCFDMLDYKNWNHSYFDFPFQSQRYRKQASQIFQQTIKTPKIIQFKQNLNNSDQYCNEYRKHSSDLEKSRNNSQILQTSENQLGRIFVILDQKNLKLLSKTNYNVQKLSQTMQNILISITNKVKFLNKQFEKHEFIEQVWNIVKNVYLSFVKKVLSDQIYNYDYKYSHSRRISLQNQNNENIQKNNGPNQNIPFHKNQTYVQCKSYQSYRQLRDLERLNQRVNTHLKLFTNKIDQYSHFNLD